MRNKYANALRACALGVMLSVFGAGVAVAGPTECTEWARGGQTGDLYHLQSQFSRTVTTSTSLDIGICGASVEGSVSTSDTFNVGIYENQETHESVQVNCSTGEVI